VKTFPLSQLARIEKGKQIDTRNVTETGKFRYINGGIKESGYYDRFNSSGPCVLISEGGASCGYVNYVDENFWCGCHCYRLSDIKARPKYLFYALKANQMALMNLRTGATMPNIKKKTLCNMPILIDENAADQEDVVRRLCLIQSAIDTKKKENEGFDALIKSRFIEMFGDPTESKDSHFLKDATTDLIRGPFGSALKKAFFVSESEDTFKIYEQKHAIQDDEKIGAYYIDEKRYRSLKRFAIRPKDIIMSCSGTIGRTHIMSANCRPGVINQALLLIRLDRTKCNDVFFQKQMDFIMTRLSTAGSAIKNISSIKVIGKTPFLLPAIDLQLKFADYAKLIDKSRFVVQQQIKDLQELLDSKMDEYFGQ